MENYSDAGKRIVPRIIIHGGAGGWTYDNLPRELYETYRKSLLFILSSAEAKLKKPHARAIDVATYAVSLLENDPLYNCGKGAVFTRAGTIELESSIMVSDESGSHKRGVGCMLLKHVKNPIKLARELLIRGNDKNGGGAQGHQQLSGEELEGLAREWDMEFVDPEYFWTKRRWEEHRRGLDEHDVPPNKYEMLPQGTVGAVVLDSYGSVCVATSTGGLTNKLPGRIGDTPTLGAGFWAEEWTVDSQKEYRNSRQIAPASSPLTHILQGNITRVLADCLPFSNPSCADQPSDTKEPPSQKIRHAVAIGGTGNGDSFLKLAACRTAAAISRYSSTTLQHAVSAVAGQDGELQKSAGDRWGKTFEGQGGMIAIELVGSVSRVVFDFNCGMFRAWVDDGGKQRCMVFHHEY